jgi:hypothetical protein
VGTIYAGDQLLRTTSYRLSVWAHTNSFDDGGDADPIPSIDGHIDINGISEAIVLAGPGTLTLAIEDGRRMAIQLANTDGDIRGKGWLPSA